jgi:D-beta-D-heptose 7-phosphate kinase/D-beta-D-heptose 1-phosphate adenosyltransferase
MDFSNLKVLVIGDVCLDIVEEGQSFRQSPEAPVPVILNPDKTYSMGMAANTALNVYNLGVRVDYTFVLGEDENGKVLSGLIQKNLGEAEAHRHNENWTTTTKHRIIANKQQVARIDFEDKMGIAALEIFIKLLKRKVSNYFKYDLIIISDYNKGIITKESWSIIRPLLEQLSDNFFVDTKKLNVLDFYKGMYIFPNTKEMNSILEFNNFKTRNDLRNAMNLDFIIETASEDGAFIYKDDGKIIHCPVFKSNVVDVTGCGDTFVAAFSLYYTLYNKKRRALEFANYCCSKAIEKKGTVAITLSEVAHFDSKGF